MFLRIVTKAYGGGGGGCGCGDCVTFYKHFWKLILGLNKI